MVANLTTPLIGIVSTIAIGRLGDATLLGGVAIASVIFNLWFVVASPLLAVFAFTYDGIFIGATWGREMRNLMLLSLAIFLATWFALRTFGNAGLWTAMLALYAARGALRALRYPANLRASFPQASGN